MRFFNHRQANCHLSSKMSRLKTQRARFIRDCFQDVGVGLSAVLNSTLLNPSGVILATTVRDKTGVLFLQNSIIQSNKLNQKRVNTRKGREDLTHFPWVRPEYFADYPKNAFSVYVKWGNIYEWTNRISNSIRLTAKNCYLTEIID